MKPRLVLSACLVGLVLGACSEVSTGGSDGAAPAADPFANLPEGVTRDQVYTRRPDPRAGPCTYYRVEGFEVQLTCET